MKIILNYILCMLPYILIALPIFLIVRYVLYKKNNSKINWYRELGLLLFTLFIVGLASQTILPKFELKNGIHIINNGKHITNLIPFKVLFDTYNEVMNGNISYFIINFLGNIIMFMPIGFFIPLLFNISYKKTILIGSLSSIFIEISQLFLIRGTDIDDVILNTIGVILGVLILKLLNKKYNKFLLKFKL